MRSKVVQQLDEDGIYIGQARAFETPPGSGRFPLPAGCVDTEAPIIESNMVARWSNGAWLVLADHRGETWYRDGDQIVIDFVGDPAERGFTQTAPEPSLSDLRSVKIKTIEAVADGLLAAGAPVAGNQHIALDDGSRADLTAMAATATAAVSGAIPWPESYARGWITIENIRLPLATPAAGLTLAAAAGNYYAAIVQHRRDLKDTALAAADETALAAIDETAGWPI